MDELTTKIAKEIIAKFDAAVLAGDFAAMQDCWRNKRRNVEKQ